MTEPTRTIGVLGAGVMGVGIAALAVGNGLSVVLLDVDKDKLAAAPTEVRKQVRLGRLMGALPRDGANGTMRTVTELAELAEVDAAVEAVTERTELKTGVLAQLSSVVTPGTLLLTNTSAIPVAELAEATARPGELAGAHFMNPPYLIRTVEVVRGTNTSDCTVDAARALLERLGREPIVVGDGPGFVINRILQRMINESARIVDEGIAEPETVDALFTGCLGHRTGPLATADLIGIDNVVDSLRVLHARTDDAGYLPAELLERMVKDGRFGRKTGRGFYEYEETL